MSNGMPDWSSLKNQRTQRREFSMSERLREKIAQLEREKEELQSAVARLNGPWD